MLPCSELSPQKGPQTDESLNSVVNDVYASEASEWRWNENWEEPDNFWTNKPATTTPTSPGLPKAAGEAPSVDEDWLDNLIDECAAPFSAMIAEINSRQSSRVDANS